MLRPVAGGEARGAERKQEFANRKGLGVFEPSSLFGPLSEGEIWPLRLVEE
jgi:hypothetical protein